MLGILLKTELRRTLRNPQFRLMWGIIVCIFLCGTISFHSQWKNRVAEFSQWQQAHEKDSFTYHLTSKALSWDEYRFPPLFSEVIDPCSRTLLPQSITYSAFKIVNYNVMLVSENPLIEKKSPLSWSFITSTLLSFVALLLSYNAVSKYKNTLSPAFLFSYPVSRTVFIFSRFLSAWLLCGLILASGIFISVVYLSFAGKEVTEIFLLESIGFFLYSMLFLSLFISFGILSSVVTQRPGSSLLICVAFWLASIVILPNCHQFIARHLYPFSENRSDMELKIEAERMRLIVSSPAGSMSSREDSIDYAPHKERAKLFTKINDSYKHHFNAYATGTFQQYEKTLNALKLSPYNLYQQINEQWLDAGYTRFKKNWEAMKVFQKEYEEWFKAEDAKDSLSPHWYNPIENLSTSRKKIPGTEFPDYAEPAVSYSQRSLSIVKYVLIVSYMGFFLLIISIFAFNKYDVR